MNERAERIEDEQPLSRRGFAKLAAAGLLAAGVGATTLRQVSAREAQPGDTRHGRGGDDVSASREAEPGDDRGGTGGADDPAGDDRGGRRKPRR